MNHFISLTSAKEMTERYRNNRNTVLQSNLQHQNILPVCETFDKTAFETLIAKPDCASLRIYYGMSEDLKLHAIIVAANAEGNDILPPDGLVAGEDDDILENGNRCPDLCPPPSPLNT